jgi:hypothetical protein
MSLKDTLQADIITAMKARETDKLATLRLLSAAIKQREVDSQTTLDDTAVVAVIEKACKQRRESIAQYQQANRQDLVDVEQYELNIISAYLPAQMSDEEINQAVANAIAQTGATNMQEMGKVMGVLKGALAGKADMSKVSALIKAQLS